MMAFLGGHYDPDPPSNVNREGGKGKGQGEGKRIDELTNLRIDGGRTKAKGTKGEREEALLPSPFPLPFSSYLVGALPKVGPL